jgi:glycosyltransferase involved in cell wall biosynthesis
MSLHRADAIDVVHCHDLDTLPAGVRLKKRLGVPLVYDAHEIWGYMVERDLPAPLPAYFLGKERRLVGHADAVITVNEPLRRYFEGIASAPVAVVMNAKPVAVREYAPPPGEAFTALYIGTLNEARFVGGLVEAVRGLDGVNLVVGGIGKPDYVRALRSRMKAVPNATFLGRVPPEEVLPWTRKAHAVLSLFDARDRLARIGLPNKVFEAMACGRPVIVSKGTYVASFMEEHGIGVVVEHSVEGVRQGIRRLRDDAELRERLGRRALEKALAEFSWEKQEERLVRVYERLQ